MYIYIIVGGTCIQFIWGYTGLRMGACTGLINTLFYWVAYRGLYGNDKWKIMCFVFLCMYLIQLANILYRYMK